MKEGFFIFFDGLYGSGVYKTVQNLTRIVGLGQKSPLPFPYHLLFLYEEGLERISGRAFPAASCIFQGSGGMDEVRSFGQ